MNKTRVSQSYQVYEESVYEEDDIEEDDYSEDGEYSEEIYNPNRNRMINDSSSEEAYEDSYYIPKQLSRANPDVSNMHNEPEGESPSHTVATSVSNRTSDTYNSELVNLCTEGDWVGLQALLTYVAPDSLSKSFGLNNMTALHLACKRAAPLSIIETLVDASPDCVSLCDGFGNLPIHYVVTTERDYTYDTKEVEEGEGGDEEVVEILLLLLQHFPDSISYKNIDGYTVLHSFFSKDLIFHDGFTSSSVIDVIKVLLDILPTNEGSINSYNQHVIQNNKNKKEDSISSEEEEELEIEIAMEVYEALRTTTSSSIKELPIHFACANVSSQTLPAISLLAKCCPETCRTMTTQGDLPIHLFYRSYAFPNEVLDATEQQVIRSLLAPCLNDLDSVMCKGSVGFVIPIHIACDLGCDYYILKELCKTYPLGVSFPMKEDEAEKNTNYDPYAIELFMESSIGIQARHVQNVLLSPSSPKINIPEHQKIKYIQQYNQYLQLSDLLFAYYPNAIPTNYEQEVVYRRDAARLNRLERLIRMEAQHQHYSSDGSTKELSTTASLVWKWMCSYCNSDDEKDNYNASIGRIITGLDTPSLWKLSSMKEEVGTTTRSNDQPQPNNNKPGTIITLQNGRTIIAEAEARAPTATFQQNLQTTKWFFFEVLQFLNGTDALNASVNCKLTMIHGIKSLLEIEGVVKKGAFEIPLHASKEEPDADTNSMDDDFYSTADNENGNIDMDGMDVTMKEDDHLQPPQPWQRLELVVSECTHSFQVSYVVEEGFGGGILVVRNDGDYVKPTNYPPWGDAVVAYPSSDHTSTITIDEIGCQRCNVVLNVSHTPGRSYGLWYFFPSHPLKSDFSLIVSQVKIRQFLFCTDRNGRSPLHCLLQKRTPVHKLCDRVSLLLKSNFGPDFYSMIQQKYNTSSRSFNHNAAMDSSSTSASASNLIQLALKCGVDEATLSLLVSSSPSSLLDCDKDRRTPLHSAFLISKNPPSSAIIKTLLVTPGENALKVKDSTGRLPIHIAAERGVSTDILLLLIARYPDGCYRTNKDDDLPIHLLIRSENAAAVTQPSVELLLRQIMKNLSICKAMGVSRMLPLHIACEYCVSTDIIQTLLKTYPQSAQVTRKDGLYPIEILELHRKKLLIIAKLERRAAAAIAAANDPNHYATKNTPNDEDSSNASLSSSQSMSDFESDTLINSLPNINYSSLDDLNTKTDWVFVYFPSIPLDKFDANSIPYRLDSNRISRLSKMVKLELILQQQQQPLQQHIHNNTHQQSNSSKSTVFQLSLLAKLCWVFLTTTPYTSSQEDLFYEDFDDDSFVRYHQGKNNDAYSNVVSGILQGLNNDVVRFLARLHDAQQREIQDVATPICRNLILSKLRFVRKYELESVYHRGNNCLLLKALDFSLEMEYEKLKKFCSKSIQDYDITKATTSSSTTIPTTTSACGLPWELFCKFAIKLGVNEKTAEKFFQRYDAIQNSSHVQQNLDINLVLHEESSEEESLTTQVTLESIMKEHEDDDTIDNFNHEADDIFHSVDDFYNSQQDSNSLTSTQQQQQQQPKRFIDLTMFEEFCKGFGMNTDNGSRKVFFKFFSHYHHFSRECNARQLLKSSQFVDWFSVPILQDYDLDRNNGDDTNKPRKRKDTLFLKEISEKREGNLFDLTKFKYAIVLPQADCDLRQIFMHEKPSITQTRHYMLQIGKTLKKIHRRRIVHGNISMGNIVRFNNRLCLIDLDSMYKIPNDDSSDSKHPDESMGGATHCWSSGLLPPEMIVKINPTTQSNDLENYDLYWKNVSEDAKDLKLLTPDDVQIVSSVVKSLLTNFIQSNAANTTVDSSNAYGFSPHSAPSSQTSLTSSELHLRESRQYHTNNQKQHTTTASAPKSSAILNLPPGTTSLSSTQWIGLQDIGLNPEESNTEWKDILSLALITISFDDLPYSLTSCKAIQDFSEVWNRLLCNAALWDKIRPRLNSQDGHVYVVRTFQENSNSDLTLLPYSPLLVSEKIDMWGFGVLTFAMCSGCNLFSVDRYENLTDAATFAQLYNWDKRGAKEIIREKVEDPLAQDLLLQILVPDEARPSSMEIMLKHPFFGLSSGGVEAQRILEKYEEQQLMLEETSVIPKMTSETKRILDCSCEKQSKIVFEEEIIVVPTCLIILPYQLRVDRNEERPVLSSEENDIDTAIQIGKHLLDINKSTAKLSFWLMMKKKMTGKEGKVFKAQLKDWLKRARSEPCDLVANEIVKAIGCGNEYIKLCREVLEREETVSQAKAYVRDPMSTARHAIRDSKELLMKCFSTQFQYLYVVDEFNGNPKLPDINSSHFVEEDSESEIVYPIKIDPNTRHLQLLFFPFINIAVMKSLAMNGLLGLTKLLGLPKSYGIPSSWNDTIPGLIHRKTSPSTIAEFSVLQDVVSKQDKQASSSWNLLGNHPQEVSTRTGISVWSETSLLSDGENRINSLEFFFREYDPMRDFAGLRRVADSENNSAAIWTSRQMIQKIQSEVEVATVETKLRDLYKELASKENIKQEIIKCRKELKRVTNNDLGRIHNNQPQNRVRSMQQQEQQQPAPPSPSRMEEEGDILVPFPDRSSDPANSILNNQPHSSHEKSHPKRRIPRPYIGKCWDK